MWPHFLGATWSSMCSPATPARSYSRTVRTALSALPYPVSASAITGSETALARCAAVRHLGEGGEAEIRLPEVGGAVPAPVMYTTEKPAASMRRAEKPS